MAKIRPWAKVASLQCSTTTGARAFWTVPPLLEVACFSDYPTPPWQKWRRVPPSVPWFVARPLQWRQVAEVCYLGGIPQTFEQAGGGLPWCNRSHQCTDPVAVVRDSCFGTAACTAILFMRPLLELVVQLWWHVVLGLTGIRVKDMQPGQQQECGSCSWYSCKILGGSTAAQQLHQRSPHACSMIRIHERW